MKILAQSLTIGYGHLLTNYLPVNTNLRNALYYNIKFLQLEHKNSDMFWPFLWVILREFYPQQELKQARVLVI